MSLSPRDMDFIALKQMAAREIALALGVPPLLLGLPGDNTYTNYQEANRTFWRQTVIPLAMRLARALSGWLLTADDGRLELRCNLDDLDALSSDREALWARLDGASFLTVDEKRAAAGYGPMAEGAKFNPHHDEAGRFTFAPGGSGDATDPPDQVTPSPRIADPEPPRPTPVAGGPKAPSGLPKGPAAPKSPPGNPTTPQAGSSKPDFLAKKPGQGSLKGKLDGLTPAEQNFAKEMRDLGKNVEVVPTGTGRTPDFKIDGQAYELKTVSGVQRTDPDGLSSAISSRVLDGRGQAADIIVDARQQAGMTMEAAERAAGRAFGADKRGGIQSITILTPGGTIVTQRR
jgi:hypothetical protein